MARPGSEHGSLERLLDRVHGRMTRLVWIHGLSTVVTATVALLLLDYALDWSLHVPRGVRWIHLFFLGAVPTYLVLIGLVRPLRARPDRRACAVLLERAHPELRQLLITAAEIGGRPRRSVEPDPAPDPGTGDLEAAILVDAESAAARLDPSRALDPRGPRLRLLVGSLSGVLCAGVLLSSPQAARVFLDRLFGGDTPWPQRTHLSIEISPARAAPSRAPLPGEPCEVRVARGSDVPVLVRAEGAVPDEVTLHFSGGHRAVITASGGAVFRTILRSVQEDLEIYATGGDDLDQDPTVRLVVLRPPDVVGLAIEVEPPAYSGLAPHSVEGGDAEVLAGSRLVVHVLPDPSDATGKARLLPEDRVVDLTRAPFPRPVRAAAVESAPEDTTGSGPGLSFRLAPEKSLRYRIELLDAAGLANPDPGLFAITVTEDRPPEVEVLAPGRGDFDTVPGGLIALRARARDDFGIARMSYTAIPAPAAAAPATPPDRAAAPPSSRDLEWRLVTREERSESDRASDRGADAHAAGASERATDRSGSAPRPSSSTAFRAVALARARIEVADLAGPESAAPGAQIDVVVSASDNHEPSAHEGKSAPLRVRVVSADEYLRRLQDRLGRVRASAAALSELQRGKQGRTLELIAGLQSDALLSGEAGDELFAAATGERRVEGDARSLSRELCSAVEGVLYARIDERATSLLDRLDQRQAASDRSFDPEVWRDIASEERAAGGTPGGLAGRLLAIAGLSLEVSEVDAPAATRSLARAQDASDLARVHAELASAAESQKAVVEKMENLLELLAEWDNYQSVLGLTRDILNGQKTLNERTRTFAKEH
jgi:hypothetical protein